MKGSRLAVVKEAFKKADITGDGIIDAKDLKRKYKVTEHPKYKNGEWDESQVFAEFLKSFEPDESKRDGKVTFNFHCMLFLKMIVSKLPVFFQVFQRSECQSNFAPE